MRLAWPASGEAVAGEVPMLSPQMVVTKWILRAVKWHHGRLRGASTERVTAATRASLALAARLMPPVLGVRVRPVDAGGVPAYWFEPRGGPSGRWVLYLHGGGYVGGGYALHRNLVGRLARAMGATVLFVDYRLAPEHPHPAALDDALAAYRWLREAHGVPASAIALAGDSAGGGLCLATMAALRDRAEALPAGAALMSPWTDLTCSGASFQALDAIDPMLSAHMLPPNARSYAGDADAAAPAMSPLFADLSGLPPCLIQVGAEEILLDDAVRLAERGRAAGMAVTLAVKPQLFHVFQAAHTAPEAWTATREIADFLVERLEAAGTLTATVPAAGAVPGAHPGPRPAID
jgi:monoterpene epsilon-lactone hydrolase